MKNLLLRLGVIVLVLGLAWFSYAAYRAHLNLVTLDVRDADLRTVVRSIEWQTWEKIVVHNAVNGKVTLSVHRVPLERVLQILGEQTSSRWMAVYPLYSSRKSLAALRDVTLGNSAADQNGWSAFQSRPMRGGGGMFGANLRAGNQLVSMQVSDKDVGVVALGLERYAQAQVVPEDGTTGKVHLDLADATMRQAVAQLASQVDRRWTRFYVLQPGFRFQTARQDAAPLADDAGADQPPRQEGPPPEVLERMEQQFQAQLETMSPDEKQKAIARHQRWLDMRNLSPEERRKRFDEMMADPAVVQQMFQRMEQRLKDSTPEERANRSNQVIARRAARGGL
jgi:hypothetical protein